jgi:capsular exopolysaccharide synthesis family protein
MIWYRIEPKYRATAAIRVAPIIPNVLFSDKDSEHVMPMYGNFKNDQARLIMNDQRVLQRVADELVDKKLIFFEKRTALSEKAAKPVEALGQAISQRIITAYPVRDSELINISVESTDPREAIQIAKAFRTAYMAIEGSKSSQGGDQKLQLLESERRVFAEKLQQQRESLRQLAEEYGSIELTPRQQMMLQRVAMLQDLVTKIEADKLLLGIKIELLGKTKDKPILPGELLGKRHTFIQNDLLFQALTKRVAELEEGLISARQILTEKNPELNRRTELLEAFKTNLEERRKAIENTFDESITEEYAKNREAELADAKLQLEGLTAREEILQAKLDTEDVATIKLGRKQLDIQEQQEQLALTKEVYDTIRRRIQQLEMERKRPARISIPYEATVALIPNKGIKYTTALVFGAMALGMFLAFLKDKADLSLRTPDDVVKRIGIRIIGTTTSPQTIKPALFPRQVTEDYQTIRANLGLLDDGGIPKKLVVTSPGVRCGKTTFAINFATSMSKSGKKVLLIDGDLRKPDIAHLLNLPRDSRGLQDVLCGRKFAQAVYSITSTGLDVLAADSRNTDEAYELLALSTTAEHISRISQGYDHVIIDTPPVLAFPDALLWAKIADAVILTSFAGQTIAPDLKEVKERLAQIDVRVLGTVLSNVPADHGYYRYGYNYYSQSGRRRQKTKQFDTKLLLPMQSRKDDNLELTPKGN